ncbi:MAG: hypothetical protein KTR27_01955 [Leptolyngbyaceae cyanobacterium MAG.088]|nr:hypothetical protein [Leptolyngbyaceae cyanobacterium MAG.088]
MTTASEIAQSPTHDCSHAIRSCQDSNNIFRTKPLVNRKTVSIHGIYAAKIHRLFNICY